VRCRRELHVWAVIESEIEGRNAPETVRDRKEKEEKASISRNDRRNECEDQKEGLHTML
jgi:hypothetical protein